MAQLAMNARVVALHNSSPFSLFFARRFNGLSNFSNDKGTITSHETLLERLKYMTEIVFPGVEAKARETQRQMIERFNRTVLHNEFPDGAKVMSLDPIKGESYRQDMKALTQLSNARLVVLMFSEMGLGNYYDAISHRRSLSLYSTTTRKL